MKSLRFMAQCRKPLNFNEFMPPLQALYSTMLFYLRLGPPGTRMERGRLASSRPQIAIRYYNIQCTIVFLQCAPPSRLSWQRRRLPRRSDSMLNSRSLSLAAPEVSGSESIRVEGG